MMYAIQASKLSWTVFARGNKSEPGTKRLDLKGIDRL